METSRQSTAKFIHLKTIDSTQEYLKKLLINNKALEGTVVLADHQNSGKGTRGKSWFSLPKPQLLFSLLLKPNLPSQKIPMVNIISGLLMATILEEFKIQAKIKWPNDLLIDGKKTGGILSELVSHEDEKYIILGMGLNIEASHEDFPTELQSTATALSFYCDSIDRFKLLEKFQNQLKEALYVWDINQFISFTQIEFRRLWAYKDRQIEVRQENMTLRGIASQIDTDGALQLITDSGTKKIINGTISVI